MTLGEYLVQLLEVYGVDHIFGIPGVHTIELYRGLAPSRVKHILPRHEQAAGFMADGYARATGRPGVCLVITGPGLTNTITAMGQAYADSIPMLVISGVNRRADLGGGYGCLHEAADQNSMVRSVTAFSHHLQSAAELPGVMARAFAVFGSERPRPVHIEIPIDLMAEAIPGDPVPMSGATLHPAAPAPAAIAQVVASLRAAQAPLLLLGGGCRAVPRDLIAAAIEAIGAPVVMTINGRDLLRHDHPLAIPASPSLHAVRAAMAQSDLLLAVGTELGRTDFDMYDLGMPAPAAPLIRVDIDPRQLAGDRFPGRATANDHLIHADSRAFFAALNTARIEPCADGASRARAIRDGARSDLIAPMTACLGFLEFLRESFPDAMIVGDSTQPVYAGNLYFGVAPPGMWFNSSVGFGTLGYALPAAIGASLGRPQQPAIALVGDGGLQFTLAELGAIPPDNPVQVIVWNNHGYGEIRSAMEAADVVPVGVDFAPPRFDLIAGAFDIAYARPASLPELRACLETAISNRKSQLIEVSQEMIYAQDGVPG